MGNRSGVELLVLIIIIIIILLCGGVLILPLTLNCRMTSWQISPASQTSLAHCS